jgi:trk system potassium uptake protein TrkA
VEHGLSFVSLLIVAVVAFLVPLVLTRFQRLRRPMVFGEILAGIIIGNSGMQLVHEGQILEVLALLGYAYLMFLSWLEVDFEAILPKPGTSLGTWQERMTNPLGLGVSAFVLTLVLAVLAGWELNALDAADDPWLAALILSTTSLGLVMPVLKERGIIDNPHGQTLLMAAVIADYATMLLVSIYVVLKLEGPTPRVLLVLLLFGAFATAWRLARVARRQFPGLNLMQGISQAMAQLDVRWALAIGLAFIALAQGLGAEIILGAFLGGALIALLADRGSSDLRHKLEVFGCAFFIPIFFIIVGRRFDLPALLGSTQALLLVPVLLVLAYAIKLAASVVLRTTYSWRETLAGGVLLSSQLSLIIAVSAIGPQLGSIDAATNSAIILVAIVTSALSPHLFNRLAPEAPTLHRKFVIASAGRLPRHLARRIAGHGDEILLSDCDEGLTSAAEELGVPTSREMHWTQTSGRSLSPKPSGLLLYYCGTMKRIWKLIVCSAENMEFSGWSPACTTRSRIPSSPTWACRSSTPGFRPWLSLNT